MTKLHIPTDIAAELKAAKKAQKKKAKKIAAAGTPNKKQTKLILKSSELQDEIAKLNKERNKLETKHTLAVGKIIKKIEKKSKKLADIQAKLKASK